MEPKEIHEFTMKIYDLLIKAFKNTYDRIAFLENTKLVMASSASFESTKDLLHK